ncbi:hypothetical protein JKF63_03625 [Porcisia hertigi]|uniref:Uncharacterized protein n=1 Tax=Porcisia hertigi TaxID=2761500 RepID=A0A836ILM8_9TRYP|nr:hypothetical protein JKF63_03625 [Porcisia hertigi]
MRSRIPLSIVFSGEGRRHAIPHRTFRVVVHAADGGACASTDTDSAEEGVAFFRYLDSNDTRMPSHPHLSAYIHSAEEYETYVGEEVWHDACNAPKSALGQSPGKDASKAQSGAASCGAAPEAVAPVPSFSGVVKWVSNVFEEEDWASDGVVLCGRYVVADDGAWVVPSRSPSLYTTREVFLLMRNSSKFLHDVHAQMMDMKAAAKEGAGGGSLMLEFTLAKSLAGSGASEMRAILPYPLEFRPQARVWAVVDTAVSSPFTGIGQRVTDVCFPSLMAWTEVEHDSNFRSMQRRIEQAALLERTCIADPAFISRLVRSFYKEKNLAVAFDGVAEPQRSHPHLALFLTVDLHFDSPSLPIYVLSAKARVFEVADCTSATWAAVINAPQWQLWTPLLVDPDSACANNSSDDAAAANAGSADCGGDDSTQTAPFGAGEESGGARESGEEEEEAEEAEAVEALNFFRIFRGTRHWNHYVSAMVERIQRSRGGSTGSDDSNTPSRGVQHFCVIASESSDLVTCADTLTKRGLPLELMHPELLEANEEATAFLKMLRDGFLKRSEVSS